MSYTQTYKHYPQKFSNIPQVLRKKKETYVLYICHKVDNYGEKSRKMSKIRMFHKLWIRRKDSENYKANFSSAAQFLTLIFPRSIYNKVEKILPI